MCVCVGPCVLVQVYVCMCRSMCPSTGVHVCMCRSTCPSTGVCGGCTCVGVYLVYLVEGGVEDVLHEGL